jgi:hypothetical protein
MEIGWTEALRILITWLVRFIPSYLVRRRFPEPRIAADVIVDLTTHRRIDFRFGSAIPEITVALRIINLNPFPIHIERIDADLWVGGPLVKDRHVFPNRVVAAHEVQPSIVHDIGRLSGGFPIVVDFPLDDLRVNHLRTQLQHGQLINDVAIYIELHGSALGRPFAKTNQRIELSRSELPRVELGTHAPAAEAAS